MWEWIISISTAEFYAIAVCLIVIACARKPDAVTGILALGFAASVAAPYSQVSLLPAIAIIDGLICVAMAAIYVKQGHPSRAWAVGFVALGKTAWSLGAAVSLLQVNSYSYAVPLNCAFLAQVAIAGGFADAIGHRLDDLCRRFWPRRYFLLRHGPR